jgi:hypothetical protein
MDDLITILFTLTKSKKVSFYLGEEEEVVVSLPPYYMWD